MAKLILSMDGLVLKEIALNKERLSIGRKPHNDIQIDNLAISGEHAVVVTILNDSFLEDLNSTNGTLVNGQPIKKHILRNNDVIELGKYKLKYMGATLIRWLLVAISKELPPCARALPNWLRKWNWRQAVRRHAPTLACRRPRRRRAFRLLPSSCSTARMPARSWS